MATTLFGFYLSYLLSFKLIIYFTLYVHFTVPHI